MDVRRVRRQHRDFLLDQVGEAQGVLRFVSQLHDLVIVNARQAVGRVAAMAVSRGRKLARTKRGAGSNENPLGPKKPQWSR